jgi:hypothetical protein
MAISLVARSRSRISFEAKPIRPFFSMKRAPMLEVMMMMAFLKSTRVAEAVGQLAVLKDLQQHD